jgi:hypothetical protein
MDISYQFTNKEITPWGGMVFLRQFLDKIGFSEQVINCPDLPQPGSNRGYGLDVLLESFICSIWCGATRFLHTEMTRCDRALSKIFGWVKVPGQDAYKRFFSKFSQTDNLRVSDHFFKWTFSNFKIDNLTLDFDISTGSMTAVVLLPATASKKAPNEATIHRRKVVPPTIHLSLLSMMFA